MKIKLLAPAKINLFLKVGNKREDGYHNIQTVFHSIQLFDRIDLQTVEKGIVFTYSGIESPSGSANIIVKTAKFLQSEHNIKQGIKIHLHKNIPIGRGLGGGSSNAASVLLGLNTLWRLNLNKKNLIRIATRIGADVPFFISGYKCAIGRGIGERLTPVRVGCRIWYLLLDPGINISTAKIFQEWDERNKKNHIKVKLSDITRAIQKGDFPDICKFMGNDLLFYICMNKTMDGAYNYFRSLISDASMTGSGSCLFAIFNDKQKALNAQKRIKKYKTYVVEGGI